jgi:hypothetical protein
MKDINILASASSNSVVFKTVPFLQALRSIEISLKTKASTDAALDLINQLWNLWKNCKVVEVRQSFADEMVDILSKYIRQTIQVNSETNPESKAASQPPLSSNSIEWQSFFKKVFDSTEPKKFRKSKKDMIMFCPLMTISLCLGDKELFLSNYWTPIVENLLKSLVKMKGQAISLIQIIFEVYFHRISEVSDTLQDRIHLLFQTLFPAKKVCLTEPECFPALVDITCSVATYKLEYVVRDVLIDLLKPDTILPE